MNAMKGILCKWLWTSIFLCLFLLPGKDAAAAAFTDSLTFKIDSAKIEGDFLEFSVMFWRTNVDWRGGGLVQDTILGNTDLNFWLEDVVFDKNVNPAIRRKHPNLDLTSTSLAFNLMNIEARYYAYRFSIKVSPKENPLSNMSVVPILYNQPMELCRVRLKMTNPNQNPGLYWDVKGTGGQSTIGEPLILALEGELKQNPKQDIVLVDNSHVQWVCEDGDLKIWAKGHSAGTGLKIAWYMSEEPDCKGEFDSNPNNVAKFTSNVTGNLVSGQLHTAANLNTAKWGTLRYHITCANDGLERVDTLHIFNVPFSMDSIYFQCELSDPTLSSQPRYSTNAPAGTDNQKTQIYIREKIQGWFASSMESMRDDYLGSNIGASDRTDTVLRCPSTGAVVSFYFFGPDCNTDHQIIGNYMDVTYQWQDALGASDAATYRVASWQRVTGQNAPDGSGKCLYKGTVLLNKPITDKQVWVKSISTEKGCNNGVSYRRYDTLYVKDLPQEQTLVASITDTTLSAGEKMILKSGFDSYALKNPSLGSINPSTKTYTAPSTSCADPSGCRDTLIYKYTVNPGADTECKMEFRQVINLSDWYYLNLKVLLEGPYVKSSGLMNSLTFVLPLNTHGVYESPYDAGTSVSTLPAQPISDWIEICLRDASDLSTDIAKVSAFLLTDGTICDINGNPYVRFKDLVKNSYYVLVKHRNHLMIRSDALYTLSISSTSITSLDLTNISNVYQGKVALLKTNIYGMFAGDCDANIMINVADINEEILKKTGVPAGYHNGDVDFNYLINSLDRTVVKKNSGISASIL